jgi:hypothetical protein
MLYDPKWENTTTKPDVFSLESLVAWLEKQPASKTYCYVDGGNCLIHQYLAAAGIPVLVVWSHGDYCEVGSHDRKSTSDSFWQVSKGYPRNFGAALERARALRDR